MFIFLSGGGRFGNQYLKAATILAVKYHIGNKFKFLNISVAKYSYLFHSPNKVVGVDNSIFSVALEFLFFSDRVSHFVAYIFYYFSSIFGFSYLYLGSESEYKIHPRSISIEPFVISFSNCQYDFLQKNTVFSGWNWWCMGLVDKYSSKIKEDLKFNEKYISQTHKIFDTATESFDYVIGVHIRLTDYLTWAGGRYFFSLYEYNESIKKVMRRFPSNKSVGIMLFSDNRNIIGSFEEHNIILSQGLTGVESHFIIDLISLSMCDCIISAPSTFAATASFNGEVPWYVMHRPDREIVLTESRNSPFTSLHKIMSEEHTWVK
jgi:hypothetical protein